MWPVTLRMENFMKETDFWVEVGVSAPTSTQKSGVFFTENQAAKRAKVKKPLLYSLICLFCLASAACTTLQVGIERTPGPDYQLTATVSALQSGNSALKTQIADNLESRAIPTKEPVAPSTEPARTPVPPAPRFTMLRFSTEPDNQEPRHVYVAGITRICAIWDYANMRAGLKIRRIWYLDGQEWISRDEVWDYNKYGASGTIQDVCIFDENTGLQIGQYDLVLLINGVPQDVGEGSSFQDRATFWIVFPDVTTPVTSPDGARYAYIRVGSRLVVNYPGGIEREMVITQEISSLNWFPDSRSLLYTERDRTRQLSPNQDAGVTNKLWILDTETGERHMLSSDLENFHNPQISPDGQYIAVLAGSTKVEGCSYSPTLAIIRLDGTLKRKAVFRLSDFSGLPAIIGTSTSGPAGNIFPSNPKNPGSWEDNHNFVTGLWWSCLNQETRPDGLYLLNMSTMEAGFAGSY